MVYSVKKENNSRPRKNMNKQIILFVFNKHVFNDKNYFTLLIGKFSYSSCKFVKYQNSTVS